MTEFHIDLIIVNPLLTTNEFKHLGYKVRCSTFADATTIAGVITFFTPHSEIDRIGQRPTRGLKYEVL